jgi:hypothetical protein
LHFSFSFLLSCFICYPFPCISLYNHFLQLPFYNTFAVGIVQSLRAGQPRSPGSLSDRAKHLLSSPNNVFIPPLRPTQPPTQWVLAALSPKIKRMGREADHSFSSSSEVRKEWSYNSSSPYACLHGVHRDYFTFSYRFFLFFHVFHIFF